VIYMDGGAFLIDETSHPLSHYDLVNLTS